jgi:succinate-acetate transporter protein
MANANPVISFPRDDKGEAVPAQIYLQPIAAPSILGLFGFAGATFMVGAHMAHWYGGAQTDLFLAPFAATFGGLAQFTAGMWAFKARDGLATAMHGMWGAFWIAFGLLQLMFITHAVPMPHGEWPGLAYWFIILGAITWMGFWAATAENTMLAIVLWFLAGGSTAAAVGYFLPSTGVLEIAGYLFCASAVVAWYFASAMMLKSSFKRVVLPLGKTEAAEHWPKLMPGKGEPGVIAGQ